MSASCPAWLLGVAMLMMAGPAGAQPASPAEAGTRPEALTVCPAGCDENDLLNAWRRALARVRHSDQVVTLQLKPGRFEVVDQLFTDCACGQQVHIVGAVDDPAKVVLTFTHIAGTNFSGFAVVDGGRVGLIDGVTILGQGASTGRASWADQSYGGGVTAKGSGSNIRLGPHVVIDGFYYGVLADEGGRVVGDGATLRNAGDSNLLARFGGIIECRSCTVQMAAHVIARAGGAPEVLGQNALAEGGQLYIDGAQLSGGMVACVGAQSNGLTWAHGVTGSGCGIGAKASQNGFIELGRARFTAGTVGVRADTGGGLNLDGVEVDHNASDGVQLDGGHATGTGIRSHDNGGYGVHVTKQGWGELYGTEPLLRGNKAGATGVDPAPGCSPSAGACRAGALVLN